MAKGSTAKKPSGQAPQPGGLSGYLDETRGVALSLLFVAPLLALYEAGLLLVRPPASSWAGGLIKRALDSALGHGALVGFNLLALAAMLVAFWSLNRRQRVRARYYPVVLVESGIYAFFFGGAVVGLLEVMRLPAATWVRGSICQVADSVVLSVGAGVYEEIIFRLLLLGGIYYLVRNGWQRGPIVSAAIAVAASSLLFAACHHVAEPFTWQAFSYRLVSGAIFALIFLARGLAVAAYTHAFYDIIVTLRP